MIMYKELDIDIKEQGLAGAFVEVNNKLNECYCKIVSAKALGLEECSEDELEELETERVWLEYQWDIIRDKIVFEYMAQNGYQVDNIEILKK